VGGVVVGGVVVGGVVLGGVVVPLPAVGVGAGVADAVGEGEAVPPQAVKNVRVVTMVASASRVLERWRMAGYLNVEPGALLLEEMRRSLALLPNW
jgi:hypothetical protein